MDNQQLLTEIEAIIKEAGAIMLEAKQFHLQQKEGNQNYVTQYDIEVENFLIKELSKLLPQASFLAEESPPLTEDDSDYCFIIDPIDGTTNFIHHVNHSAISVALTYKKEALLGLVYNPYTNEMFTGLLNSGAYLNQVPINVSQRSFSDSIIAFGTTPYDRNYHKATMDTVYRCLGRSRETRRMGTASLDLVYLACGRFDGFFEYKLQPWDYAAGSLIITEAQGLITTKQGEKIDLFHPCSIVAGNHLVYYELMNIVEK